MSADARYCMQCGIAIEPLAMLAILENDHCPRCGGALRSILVEKYSIIECSACGGIWLPPGTLEDICSNINKRSAVFEWLQSRESRHPREFTDSVVYLSCPRCRDLMVRRNFMGRSGVIIDICKDHGVWLDHAELEKITKFAAAGGLEPPRNFSPRIQIIVDEPEPALPRFLRELKSLFFRR